MILLFIYLFIFHQSSVHLFIHLVIGEFSRFSESEFKNEETVHVVHSDWLLFHCDAYLSSFCDVEFSLKLVTSDDQKKKRIIHKSCRGESCKQACCKRIKSI